MKEKMTSPEHSERHAWTEAVLHSLDGLQRATAPEGIYDRMMQRVQQPLAVAKHYVWLAAAGFALLFILNAWVWKGQHKQTPQSNLAEQFQLTNPSTIDYD